MACDNSTIDSTKLQKRNNNIKLVIANNWLTNKFALDHIDY